MLPNQVIPESCTALSFFFLFIFNQWQTVSQQLTVTSQHHRWGKLSAAQCLLTIITPVPTGKLSQINTAAPARLCPLYLTHTHTRSAVADMRSYMT